MGLIKDIMKHFKAKADGVTVQQSITHSYTEREVIERIEKCVQITSINRNASYEDYTRELALDQLILELLGKRLREIEDDSS